MPQGPRDHQEDQAQVGEEVRFQYSDQGGSWHSNSNIQWESFRLTSRETMKEKDLVASRWQSRGFFSSPLKILLPKWVALRDFAVISIVGTFLPTSLTLLHSGIQNHRNIQKSLEEPPKTTLLSALQRIALVVARRRAAVQVTFYSIWLCVGFSLVLSFQI